jgi:hypothetical protein
VIRWMFTHIDVSRRPTVPSTTLLESPPAEQGQVRIVFIPGEWTPPVPGVFIKETMNNLADLGIKMGADLASWSNAPPGF